MKKRSAESKVFTNRLVRENSPYLLQHAHNPVDWYAWGKEAFDKARHEDKPIFLSIGYSTCHWCHVMEREAFSDPEAAALINRVFIPVKVDREERPDIDEVYMTVAQLMTGHGGWPLNIIMTPDKQPFFAATYLPKQSQYGRPGLMELIPRIEAAWKEDRDNIYKITTSVTSALGQMSGNVRSQGKLKPAVLNKAYEQLAGEFDTEHGGFGQEQKFPRPHNMRFLLRYWKRTGNMDALSMVEKTLHTMRNGGIYDHIGFGFHRYATDLAWRVPHFEKMLYDQALISTAYIEAWLATGDEAYADTVREIFTYVLRDMSAPEGGFYSAEDADSEGEEGRYYLWDEAEVRKALDKETADLFMRVFNVQPGGNFVDPVSGKMDGRNIIYRSREWPELANQLDINDGKLRRRMREAIIKLLAVREKRVHPYLDDKVLTDWNGLMIAALAKGARALDEPEYARAASKAAGFILRQLRTKDGRLLHRFRKSKAGIAATLDDYAFFVWGLLELYEAEHDPAMLEAAIEINRIMLGDFGDKEGAGLYTTAKDAEALLVRSRQGYDGAVPSGNSVALSNQLRLARITGSTELEEAAQDVMSGFSGQIEASPSGFTHFMLGVDFAFSEGHEIVIVGDRDTTDTQAMLRELSQRFMPNSVTLLLPTSAEKRSQITSLAPFTKLYKQVNGRATAYVCRNYSCNQPTTSVDKMLKLLDGENGETSE
ncbi:MAG: thioredoxin domain-containing protein [Mariprofundaceae bacterium]